MRWETFTKRRAKASIPKVSVRKQGTLGIGKKLYKEHLKDVEHVELLYSQDENKIGIHPLEDPVEHSYVLRTQGPNIEISAMAFLSHYEIPHEETIQYRADFEDGVVVVDLNDRLN